MGRGREKDHEPVAQKGWVKEEVGMKYFWMAARCRLGGACVRVWIMPEISKGGSSIVGEVFEDQRGSQCI